MGKTNNKIVEMAKANLTDKEMETPLIITDEQRKMFNMAMDNVKSFSTCKSNRKNIGIVAIDLSLLYVDIRYQRLRAHKRIRKLINNWDERKLGAIVVVPHPEECRFAVVDGQGRLTAAKQLGYETLQAVVLLDAPEDPDERLKFEAEVFIGQDDEIEKVKPLEKHPARVIIGDKAALALEKMFTKYHISYVDAKGIREAGVLGSYPTTYKIAQTHGEKCLEFMFSIIRNASWDNESNGYATFVTESLKNIWVSFQGSIERKRIHAYLSETLREIDPALFSSKARTKYPMREARKACTLYLEDMIESSLGLKKVA